jgi:hypothetical protein
VRAAGSGHRAPSCCGEIRIHFFPSRFHKRVLRCAEAAGVSAIRLYAVAHTRPADAGGLGSALCGKCPTGWRPTVLRLIGLALDMVAVGMPVTRHPPHRSRRAELPHRALASGSNAQALCRVGMQDSGLR